ncbi:MAG: ATP-dependent helicase, partial [Candidatus Krumholzibacteriia bacterium]
MQQLPADLNPAQRAAVEAADGPVLVVAGAGSGKTRVLTTRVAWLLGRQGVAPGELLAFTFTNRAAREMRERVERLVGPGGSPRWMGTFHATGAKLLRMDGAAIGVPPGFTIYDSDDSLRVVKRAMERVRFDAQTMTPNAVRARVSRWKNDGRPAAEAAERAVDLREERCAQVYGIYEAELRKADALDFDDLILRTVELLAPGSAVQQKWSRRFRHVLVDEFQDTNRLQMVLIKALAQHHGNVFVVGDDDQSIYGWRGACIENMLEFEQVFPGTRVIRLEQNYRSTGNILAAANAVIAHNRHRKGKTLWTADASGDLLRLDHVFDEEDEAARVVDIVRAGGARGDVTVLYRTNAQSRALEDALRRAVIPYQIIGGTQFYERREVRDLLAYLKLIANPRDAVAAVRVLNVPRRKIGDTTAARLRELADAADLTLAEAAERSGLLEATLPAAACRRVRAFFAQVDAWRAAEADTPLPALLERIMIETGYREWLTADDPSTAEGRLENVAELVNAAQAFVEATEGGRLAVFLEQTALVADADAVRDDEGVVRLMTIHTAKGLEFPVVILAGCEEGLLPHANSAVDDRGLEEERRLFYVALTRARRRVYLLQARSRRRAGQRELSEPSRFLAELPPELLEHGGEAYQVRESGLADY